MFILDYYYYYWGHSDLFCSNLGENKFSWKKAFCQFLNIPNIYHRAKNQKNDLQENDEGQADRQR